VLLVRRPPRGLLGGMRALPVEPPCPADWREAGVVRHVFTHFELTMRVMRADAATESAGEWWPVHRIDEAGLPTLFRKAAAAAREAPLLDCAA
jgi:A/G-specific adenine glycosylase